MGLRLIILKFLKVFDFIIHFVLSLDFPGPTPEKVDQKKFWPKFYFYLRPSPGTIEHFLRPMTMRIGQNSSKFNFLSDFELKTSFQFFWKTKKKIKNISAKKNKYIYKFEIGFWGQNLIENGILMNSGQFSWS